MIRPAAVLHALRLHLPALRVRSRLSSAFLLLALLGGISGATGLWFVERISASVAVLAEVTTPVVDLTSDLQESLQHMQVVLLGLLAQRRSAEINRSEDVFDLLYSQSQEAIRKLDGHLRRHDLDIAFQQITARLDQFRAQAKRVIAAHRAEVADNNAAQATTVEFDRQLGRARASLEGLLNRAEAAMQLQTAELRTLLAQDATTPEVAALVDATSEDTFPALQRAYQLNRALAQLPEIARQFLLEDDEFALQKLKQHASALLALLSANHSDAARSVTSPAVTAEWHELGTKIADLGNSLTSEKGLFGMRREALKSAARTQSLRFSFNADAREYDKEIAKADSVAHDRNDQAQRESVNSITAAYRSVAASVAGSVIAALALAAWFTSRLVARDDLIVLQKQEGARLGEQTRRLDLALTSMTQGLCMFDRDNHLIVMNERYAHMYAVPEAIRQPGTKLCTLLDHLATLETVDPPDGFAAACAAMVEQGLSTTSSHRLADGRSINVTFAPTADGGWVYTHQDITERSKAEALVAHMAHHDALTNLPNRVLFRERMERAIRRLRRDESTAVLCLDLDGFKQVNDTLGHPAGDELLRLVAGRLRDSTRETDTVARLGGDEFAVIQSDSEQPESATALATRLVEALRQPFELTDQRVEISTSIGIAMASTTSDISDELLRNADIALYRAKADGRGIWRLFEPEMDQAIQRRRLLESELRTALADEQFEVHYQPLVDARAQTLTGFEALIRWRHPDRGLVSPGEFIPLAEEMGIIRSIGAWVLNRACQDAVDWPEHVKVAVNLSPVQFVRGNLIEEVKHALAVSGLATNRLELEITESFLLQDTEATLGLLHELRSLGVSISMDDFGTGYSSLSYLRRFPFDKIKVDQSFVRTLKLEKGSVEIVRAVVGLGKALNMTVIAEGVETTEQLEILRTEGCNELQGFLFSKPVPLRDVQAVMVGPFGTGKGKVEQINLPRSGTITLDAQVAA